MASRDESSGLQIGEVLKRARSRQKLDIQTVEDRTKIRTKYLRALENEEWEVLPGHPYAKGFLRTYAQCLGLDGDALVDEYRRTVESSLGAGAPLQFAEPVLERRRRVGEPPRRWPARAGVLAIVAAAAAVGAVLIFGGSGDQHHGGDAGKGRGGHSKGYSGSSGGGSNASKPVKLSLTTRSDMRLCLVPGHGKPLIDSQTLIGGSHEGPFDPPAENYRLDLETGGALTANLGGKPQRIASSAPASFKLDAGGVKEISFVGPNCR
ncbi:MAG: helix-turn-helix domain-containing protein [Solirubrobacterales bacterium]